jgi:ABC-type multidrug transport system fused ATPase/permease subunit
MKILFYSLVFILLAVGLQLILPWWIISLIALGLSYAFGLKPLPAFLLSFLLAALVWGVHAAYINHLNEGLMAARIGDLFGGLSGSVMVAVTAVFAGLFAGIGALIGSLGKGIQ